MNILLATYWYLPHVGGVDVYVNVLKKQLEARGHRVDVLAHHPHMTKVYLMNRNDIVRKHVVKDLIYERIYDYYEKYLPHVDPWIRWREIERYTFELLSLSYNLNQYDLIHTQDIIATRAIHRVKPRGVKHVATIHGLVANEHVIAGDIVDKSSQRWVYVSAEEYYGSISSDLTILPTKWLQNVLHQEFHVPKSHSVVVPYGIDIPDLLAKGRERPRDVAVDARLKTMICPARLVPVKGHQYLLEALSILKRKRNDFMCWIVGDGELEHSLKSQAAERGLTDCTSFLGSRPDVAALLRLADLAVLPSVQDNLPFTVIESQVLGVPVVASAAGGIPEMIKHGQTGLLFDVGNSAQLAERLDTLLSEPHLRRRIARKARTWGLHHWSSSTMTEHTLRLYDRVLNHK